MYDLEPTALYPAYLMAHSATKLNQTQSDSIHGLDQLSSVIKRNRTRIFPLSLIAECSIALSFL